MNFVCISPHFPINYYPFCIHLHDFGANVLGLADEPYENLRPELTDVITEYYRVPAIQNYDEMLRGVGYFTYKYGKISRLESHNEFWLENDARLRTDFNIPGIKVDQIDKIKRKSEMKKIFQQSKIPAAPGRLINNIEQALQFTEEEGYPVIVKPDIGVGAGQTYKLHHEDELREFFLTKPPVDYFIETFVEGDILTFDGLTDQQGNVVFTNSIQYSEGVMESVIHDRDILIYTLREINPQVEKYGRMAVNAFDVKERFFHFEFFRKKDNQILALEVNLRPPGGTIMDMMNFSNDIDLYREYANIVLNNRFDARSPHLYHVGHVGRKYNKSYKYSHEDIMNTFGDRIVQNDELPLLYEAAMGNYVYLIRTSDLDEMHEIASYIREKI